MSRWLTAAEVATRLGIGADLVARYCKEGRWMAEKTTAGWLSEPASVETFAAARRRAGRPSKSESRVPEGGR